MCPKLITRLFSLSPPSFRRPPLMLFLVQGQEGGRGGRGESESGRPPKGRAETRSRSGKDGGGEGGSADGRMNRPTDRPCHRFISLPHVGREEVLRWAVGEGKGETKHRD